MASSERIGWIDSARGVGMVAVVAGHVFSNDVARHVIFTFHMPLFFLLSGWMFRPPASLTDLTLKRLRTLILPYVAFLLLVTALDIAIGAFDGVRSLPLAPRSLAVLVFGGSLLSGAQTVFWFVPCLFVTNIVYAMIAARSGGPRRPATVVIVIAWYVLACLMSAMHAKTGLPKFTPVGLGQVPLAIAFFWTGAVLAERPPPWPVMCVALVMFGLGALWAPAIDMKTLVFGMPVVSYGVALAGSLGLIMIGRVIAPLPLAGRIAGEIGRASLVIMFVHMLAVMHLRDHYSEVVVFVASLGISYVVYLVLGRFHGTGVVFLGREPGLRRSLPDADAEGRCKA